MELKDNLITPNEAAGILRCSQKTIYRLLKDGRIKGFKIGSRIKIHASTITPENLLAVKPMF
jgi:excisionase family DNA binding protein